MQQQPPAATPPSSPASVADSRIIQWMARYEHELRAHRALVPDRYLWGDEKMPEVLERMRASFLRGPNHFNKNSHAIRATCKFFGIPLTFTAIDQFIRGV